MAKMDTQTLVNYGARGLGAVALPAILNNYMPTIMANQILAYSLMGVSVGAVLAAGIGILAVDNLLLK